MEVLRVPFCIHFHMKKSGQPDEEKMVLLYKLKEDSQGQGYLSFFQG
jgi:hypothetical protein